MASKKRRNNAGDKDPADDPHPSLKVVATMGLHPVFQGEPAICDSLFLMVPSHD
ncbi:MAG: hypothetical protein O2782_15685 [bacterium]|nr:hypothetical protein [bacterium]